MKSVHSFMTMGRHHVTSGYGLLPVVLLVTLGLSVGVAQAQSGSLEPPASAVDAMGNPVPTTQTQPSWDQTLLASERFVLVMNNEAVLDKETGRVWQKSLDTNTRLWTSALEFCYVSVGDGSRKGWRLPTIEELTSLVIANNLVNGSNGLPQPNPFVNVQTGSFDSYWSATTRPSNTSAAYTMFFGSGSGTTGAGLKTASKLTWCVRGGNGHDAH